jgi:hypothetical protein
MPSVDIAKSQPTVPATTLPPPAAPPQTVPASIGPAPQPTASSTTPATNPATDIANAVAAYARALESRDVATVRRAYPGLTSAQAKAWEQFFPTLRSLRVALAINHLDVNGASADAKLLGSYDYVSDEGKAVQQPVSFQASFRREAGMWVLSSVH